MSKSRNYRESHFSDQSSSADEGDTSRMVRQSKEKIPPSLRDVRVSSSYNPEILSSEDQSVIPRQKKPVPMDSSDDEDQEYKVPTPRKSKTSKVNTKQDLKGRFSINSKTSFQTELSVKKRPSPEKKRISANIDSSDGESEASSYEQPSIRGSVIDRPLDSGLSVRRHQQPNQGKPKAKVKREIQPAYDSSDEESKHSSVKSFKKMLISHTQTQLTETKLPNYAYQTDTVLHNSYMLPQIVEMSKNESNLVILYCGHYLREKELRNQSKKPGEVECPVCKVITLIKQDQPLKMMKQEVGEVSQSLSEILRKIKQKAPRCEMPKCKTPKSNDLAFIIETKLVICKDCLFEEETNQYSWIGLDHLPGKLAQEFKINQEFFEKKAKFLELYCEKIKSASHQIDDFNLRQKNEFNSESLEMQKRIDQRLEEQVLVLNQGKQKYLDRLKSSARLVDTHISELTVRRNQLRGLLSEMKRSAREIPSKVKVGLDVEGKIASCAELRESQKIGETKTYRAPQFKEDLNFEGLVNYRLIPHTIEENDLEEDEDSIWNTYVGDLKQHPQKYEELKKNSIPIGMSSFLEK